MMAGSSHNSWDIERLKSHEITRLRDSLSASLARHWLMYNFPRNWQIVVWKFQARIRTRKSTLRNVQTLVARCVQNECRIYALSTRIPGEIDTGICYCRSRFSHSSLSSWTGLAQSPSQLSPNEMLSQCLPDAITRYDVASILPRTDHSLFFFTLAFTNSFDIKFLLSSPPFVSHRLRYIYIMKNFTCTWTRRKLWFFKQTKISRNSIKYCKYARENFSQFDRDSINWWITIVLRLNKVSKLSITISIIK